MPKTDHWQSQEKAYLSFRAYQRGRPRKKTEPIEVCEDTFKTLRQEAALRTWAAELNGRVEDGFDPGDVVDYMVKMWRNQKAFAFLSNRPYKDRVKRGC